MTREEENIEIPEPGDEPAVEGPEPKEVVELDLSEENERLKDRLLRLQAEFDNYRKRVARERVEWIGRALESFAVEVLPVMDSFDRDIASAADATDAAGVLEGMELVRRQLESVLQARDIEPVDALGLPFDPNLHEGFVSRAPEGDEEPGTVVEEFVKGYRMGDRTIRATKAVVAAQVTSSDSAAGSEEE